MIAWGAYFASKNEDSMNEQAYATLMVNRMARWVPPATDVLDSDDPVRISRFAMSEILYALIEKDEQVPVLSLEPMVGEFPVEALILAARLPSEQVNPFLQKWYEERNQTRKFASNAEEARQGRAAEFALFAGMLLANAPPPGFAATVLGESNEKLSFWVADGMWEKSIWQGGPSDRCTASDENLFPAGALPEFLQRWPPLFQYQLQQNTAVAEQPLLVDAGGERISYRRLSKWVRPGDCTAPRILPDDMRHHILAEMLGLSDAEMVWPADQLVIYLQGSKQAFLPALKSQIEAEESKFRATIQALHAKGYLTQSEADMVRPRLSVVVNDVRSTVVMNAGQEILPPVLPRLSPGDERVSIVYDKR
jgi:hypothetical protein